MSLTTRKIAEAMEVAMQVLGPIGCQCEHVSNKRHIIVKVLHKQGTHTLVFAKSPRSGFQNLKDWVRQDANKIRRKIEGGN